MTTVAGPDMARFSELKVGDKVTAKFYENVVVRLKAPGESEGYSAAAGTTCSEQVLPGGTKAKQVSISATITGITPEPPTITFTGPNGWKYSRKVLDKNVLKQVKVGDQVDFVWTEAVQIRVESPKK